MKWCTIKKEYIDFMKNEEPRIPNIEYGSNSLKPFFSPLFKVGNLVYVTQVSSAKDRHNFIKEDKDFVKLYDGSKLVSVVNLNYMFPVPEELIIEITYKNIDNFRTFTSDIEKNNYIVLLKKEKRELKIKCIDKKAQYLYAHRYTFPNDRVSLRCFDFKKLEEVAKKYK